MECESETFPYTRKRKKCSLTSQPQVGRGDSSGLDANYPSTNRWPEAHWEGGGGGLGLEVRGVRGGVMGREGGLEGLCDGGRVREGQFGGVQVGHLM